MGADNNMSWSWFFFFTYQTFLSFPLDVEEEAEENMSSPPVDPLQSDSLVQPLVEELAITRSPSSSEGEVEQVTLKHFLIIYMCSCHVCCCSILWRKGDTLVNRFAAISCKTSLNFNNCRAMCYT